MPIKRYEHVTDEQLAQAHKNDFLEPTITLDDWPAVKGYDFEQGLDFNRYLESLFNTGFQSTELAKAIRIVKQMRESGAIIFLGFTSNMASCGVRDIIAYLAKHKLVDVLVTSIGGIEEDVIKSFKPFVIGNYDAPGGALRNKGINRTGNIFIPNDRYLAFERFVNPFLQEQLQKQQTQGKARPMVELVKDMGLALNDESSITTWAAKNDIPFFCPSPTDGSFGDLVYFFKQKHKEFQIDVTEDIVRVTNIALNAEKTGIIALGGSAPKHFIANANLFREGADFAVYLTTAQEFEGSNAGANVQEAMSWGKVKERAPHAKVVGDASITFPLLVAGGFVSTPNKEEKDEDKTI